MDLDEYVIEVNEVQSPVTEDSWKKMDREVRMEFNEILEQIELVQNLISPTRRYAKDMPKDSKGRIIVDLENPHILENMDYFRQPAITYKEYGRFTTAFPNPHPSSEYRRFWEEMAEYCVDGLVREDGEWITGYHFFYLNFAPILLTKDKDESEQVENSDYKQADRIEDFPDIWDGDYLYYHYIQKGEMAGMYGCVLKTRGRGFSFKGGSMSSRNQVIINKSRTFMMASETEYLNKDGIWNKYSDTMDFIGDNTPWPRARLKNDQNKMHIVLGYKDAKTDLPKGMKSEVLGVTLKDNPQKARGKRGKLIQWEEAGKFPGLLQAWSIARMSLEQGRSVFGYMVAFGTGGTEGADFEALEKFFYYPEGYKIYSMRNVFDKVKGKGRCAFFFPEYLNRNNCYDENGNSDVVKALIETLEDRWKVRKGTDDPHALTQEKADRPITPQEAVMRMEGNLFPVEQLKDYLADISPNIGSFLAEHSECEMFLDQNGVVQLHHDINRIPIREFPVKHKADRKGCIEIFQHPQFTNYGEVQSGRYIAGIDTYDDDEGASLGSIFIFDLITDNIVAEYSGRRETANDFYQTCALLCLYYNAKANYENNKKGLYSWFLNNKLDYLLCETPEILKDMQLVKAQNLYGNKGVGTNATIAINQWGRRLQSDWMKTLSYTDIPEEQVQVMIDGSGEIEIEEDLEKLKSALKPVPNLRRIRSIGYIKEAIAWNEDGNFDRVSAMNMVMILREQNLRYVDTLKDEDSGNTELANDPFFTRNYTGESENIDIFEEINKSKSNNFDLDNF